MNVFSWMIFFSFSWRMIIPWPAFHCWVTLSASPQTLRTSTRTTYLNCISSPTSTTSDQRANTRLRGTDALNDLAVMLHPGCRRVNWSLVFLQVDGGHPQCHTQLQRRSRPEQQRISSSLSWICLSRVPSCWRLCFSFSTHTWNVCTCGHAHMVLFFLTLYWWHVRWFRLHQRLHFWLFLLSTLKPLFKDVILYSFLTVSATTHVSGFTFCRWLYLTAEPCRGPSFCPRWFSFHHIVMTFFFLNLLLADFNENCCFEMPCNFSAKLIYTVSVSGSILMLFCFHRDG